MLHRSLLSAAVVQLCVQAVYVHGSVLCRNSTTAAETCTTLQEAYPDLTFFPNDTSYTTLNQDYFTAAEWLGPACIFAPTSADIMSYAVKELVSSDVPFAVRGGGHMPIAGSANINSSGILLAASGLKQLEVSDDRSTVSVGPGNRWGAVYRFLDDYQLAVVGGRLGVVGVPGLLLGGGISFFGNEYGWASNNIAAFEAVLADGTVVTATAENEYSDLFWALRGGGNSFAIVTTFVLNAIPSPGVTVGQSAHGAGLRNQYLDSVYGFAYDGTLDKKAAIVATVGWTPSVTDELNYSSMLFYNGNDTTPAALANFTGPTALLPANSTTFAYRTLGNWANESEAGFDAVHGLQFRFHVLSLLADREAMGTIFDTFFGLARERLANVTAIGTTLAFMPISESFITANRGPDPSGDPFGIDASKAPYIWVEEALFYAFPSDEPIVNEFLAEANTAIGEALDARGVASPYLYLNDADKDQPVFEGYAPENLARLKEIRAKYDPTGVYTYQEPGGFKVALA